MLPLAFGSAILGGFQAGVGLYNLLNMEDRPNFEVSPEQQNSYNRAQERARFGFSTEQRNDYFNGIAGRYSQGWRNATDLSGGQQSQAFGRAMLANQTHDFSRFAAEDARLMNDNARYADRLGADITAKRDMIANQNIQDWNKRQQAFGGALSSGLNNFASAANFFGMNGGFDQLGNPTAAVDSNGQLNGAGFTPNGVNYGVGGMQNGQYNINAGVAPSAPAGGWAAQNQAAMEPSPSDWQPDGLGIDNAATQYNNPTLISPYGRYNPWGGVNGFIQ